jgi:hypothetical protein
MMMNRLMVPTLSAVLALSGCGVETDVDVSEQSVKNNSATVAYGGQGLLADGFGGYDLVTEICGTLDEFGNVTNGADAAGPYLLWVLTATGATSATITIFGITYPMTASGNGTFKYVSAWFAPSTLTGNVSATYAGRITNAQLVISHGCRPYTHGAWCSPGFWGQALLKYDPTKGPGAWSLTSSTPADPFTGAVPDFYVLPELYDGVLLTATLGDVLTSTGGTYKTPAADPYGLTPFNAAGAFLTNQIPGYTFDASFMVLDESDTCPIDHHGNWKEGAGPQ